MTTLEKPASTERTLLGRIPVSWRVVPLWTLFDRVKRTGFEDEELLSVYRDYGVVIKSTRDDNNNSASEDLSSYQLVEPGDLAVNKMKAWQGSVAISTHRGIVSPAYFIFKSRHSEYGRFLHYLLRSSPYIAMYARVSKGVRPNQWDLDPQHHSRLPVALPSLDEQRQIADYLDAQTAKIDTLIGKQERLIETLAERLDGLWSESLDSLAADFPTVPLRRVIRSITDGPFGSSLTSAHYTEEGASVVRLGNIGVDEFKTADRVFISATHAKELRTHSVRPGDVVVAGLGDATMPLGRAAIVPRAFGTGIVKADCYRVTPGPLVAARYLAWSLSSPQARTQFRALSRGSTRQRLNTQVVREVEIPIPPLEHQVDAVDDFHNVRAKYRLIEAKAREMIDVLRERRQALISAAVTGKIDVRTTEAP